MELINGKCLDSTSSTLSSRPKSTWIPIRYLISILGIYSSALVYTQRTAMSVAIVAMIKSNNNHNNNSNDNHICAINNNNNNYNNSIYYFNAPYNESYKSQSIAPTYDWNETMQGIILGAHFWFYTISPAISGRLCDKFGSKWITVIGNVGSLIMTSITPLVVENIGAIGLIIVRLLSGLFHGCTFSTLFTLYVQWFPPHERPTANAGMSFGCALGTTIMSTVAGWLASTYYGWPLVFYVNSIMYIPFLFLWIYFVHDSPLQSQHISDSELDYLKKYMINTNTISKMRKQAPWSKIFTSRAVLASALCKLCSGYGYFLLLSKVPSYLSTVFGLALLSSGGINAAMSLGQGIVSLFTGPFSSWIIERFGIESIIIRKFFQSLAMIGPAIGLALIPVAGCNSNIVIACLIVSLCIYGTMTGGEWSTISQYAPNSSGFIFGVTNSLPVAAGIAGPYIVGVILGDDPTQHLKHWNIIFYSTSGVFALGAIGFIILGTDKPQEWDSILNEASTEDAKETVSNNHEKLFETSTYLKKNIIQERV